MGCFLWSQIWNWLRNSAVESIVQLIRQLDLDGTLHVLQIQNMDLKVTSLLKLRVQTLRKIINIKFASNPHFRTLKISSFRIILIKYLHDWFQGSYSIREEILVIFFPRRRKGINNVNYRIRWTNARNWRSEVPRSEVFTVEIWLADIINWKKYR